MNVVWVAFAGGVLAFAHCLGMCGGFALHLAQAGSRWQAFERQLCWHAGRVLTYVFLGAVAGFAGGVLGASARLAWTQRALAYATGSVMLLAGLVLLGMLPIGVGRGWARSGLATLMASVFRQLFQNPDRKSALVLGVGTGFLPCPIVVGFLALAAHHGSVPVGMATMAALGLGTAGSLLVLGVTGGLFNGWFRRWGSAAAGLVLVLLGLATVLRGTEAWHRVLGCPGATPACCSHEK
jgi:uncharacterized protein